MTVSNLLEQLCKKSKNAIKGIMPSGNFAVFGNTMV